MVLDGVVGPALEVLRDERPAVAVSGLEKYMACAWMMTSSSFSVHFDFFTEGHRWLYQLNIFRSYRSRHCLPTRPGISRAIFDQFLGPCAATSRVSTRSCTSLHGPRWIFTSLIFFTILLAASAKDTPAHSSPGSTATASSSSSPRTGAPGRAAAFPSLNYVPLPPTTCAGNSRRGPGP